MVDDAKRLSLSKRREERWREKRKKRERKRIQISSLLYYKVKLEDIEGRKTIDNYRQQTIDKR